MLHVLKPHITTTNLPLDARTLLQTPILVELEQSAGGFIKYFGIKKKNLLKQLPSGINKSYYPILQSVANDYLKEGKILLTLSVDGIPLYKSSPRGFWPILGIFDQAVDKTPFIIALYFGESKPTDSEEFVEECLLLENGFIENEIQYVFRISCIIADAPARQFLKSMVSYASYNACKKCCQEKTYYGRMTWPHEARITFRTDEGFKNSEYMHEHQKAISLLTHLSTGLVTQVP